MPWIPHEQQDFVFCISVQGHGDYPAEKVLENPRITVSGIEDEGRTNAWEYYVNQLYEMDQFIREHLVTEIKISRRADSVSFSTGITFRQWDWKQKI